MKPHKIVNGIKIDLTAEEIALRSAQEAIALERAAKTEYIRKRLDAYPSIGDQLDLIYWDRVNGTNAWQELITEIKQKYPKPT